MIYLACIGVVFLEPSTKDAYTQKSIIAKTLSNFALACRIRVVSDGFVEYNKS